MVEDNLRGDQVVPLMEVPLDRVGRSDERGELQVLVRKFGEFDAPVASLELVTERRHLHRAEGVNAAVLPHAIQGSEPCRAELSSGRREVQVASGDGQTSSPRRARKCQSSWLRRLAPAAS